mmetsp:Transcript_20380/g.56714  ORF Transcript_20380/g.56714 Transcript_20380/m.56714 type:complete len:211 (-) Transcript_20380:225-857(-)
MQHRVAVTILDVGMRLRPVDQHVGMVGASIVQIGLRHHARSQEDVQVAQFRHIVDHVMHRTLRVSIVKDRVACRILSIGVDGESIRFEQVLQHFTVPARGREMQRRLAVVVRGEHISIIGFDHELHQLELSFSADNVEGCVAVVVRHVDAGTRLHQVLRQLRVIVEACDMQGRVAPTNCHVQRELALFRFQESTHQVEVATTASHKEIHG